MKIIVLLAVLAFAASAAKTAELAQKDAVIRVEAQQPVKNQDYLVNDEEFTSVRVAAQSAIQGYGTSSADSEVVGNVLRPVPNSQPVPFTGVYGVAPAPIVASPVAASQPMMPMPYSFQYAVRDDAKDLKFGHQADSDGNVVIGSYYVLLPDGRLQTVNYQADDNGYVAKVTYDDDDDDDEDGPSKLQSVSAAFAQQQTNQQSQQSGGYGLPVPVPTQAPPQTVRGPSPASAYQAAPPSVLLTQITYPVDPVRLSVTVNNSSQLVKSAATLPATSSGSSSSSSAATATATSTVPSTSRPALTSAGGDTSSSAASVNATSSRQPSQTAPTAQSTSTQQGATLTLQIPSSPIVQVSSSAAAQTTSNVQNTQQGATLTVQTSSSPAFQVNIASAQNAQQAAVLTAQVPPSQSANQSVNVQNVQTTLTIQKPPVPTAQLNSQLSVNAQQTASASTTARPPAPATSPPPIPMLVSVTAPGQQTAAQVQVVDIAVTTAFPAQGSQVGLTRPPLVAPVQAPVLSTPASPTTSRPLQAVPNPALATPAPSGSLGLLQLQLCASCPPRFPSDVQPPPTAPANVSVQQTPSVAPAPTSSLQAVNQPNWSQNAQPLNQPIWSQNVQPANRPTLPQNVLAGTGYSIPPSSTAY